MPVDRISEGVTEIMIGLCIYIVYIYVHEWLGLCEVYLHDLFVKMC